MSYRLVEKIIDSEAVAKLLDPVSKYILTILARFADDDGTHIFPSKATLSRCAGCCRDTVYEHLDRLIKSKFLIDTGQKKVWSRGHTTTIYSINTDLIDSVDSADSVDSVGNPPSIPPTSSVDSADATLSRNSVKLKLNRESRQKRKPFEVES